LPEVAALMSSPFVQNRNQVQWLMNVATRCRRSPAEYFRLPPWVWELESACVQVVVEEEKLRQQKDDE
jgi:hypothetical protein